MGKEDGAERTNRQEKTTDHDGSSVPATGRNVNCSRSEEFWRGTGIYAFERKKTATLTSAQEKRLRANRKAAAFFDAQPPWYRRTVIHWVISAKREETRECRLSILIRDSAAGRTVPPLTRPTRK